MTLFIILFAWTWIGGLSIPLVLIFTWEDVGWIKRIILIILSGPAVWIGAVSYGLFCAFVGLAFLIVKT